MPEFDAARFLADPEGYRPERQGFDAAAFVGTLTTAGPPGDAQVDLAQRRANAELLGAQEAAEPLEIEFPHPPSRKIPRSMGEAITQAGREGTTLEMSEGLWKELDQQARLLAYSFVKSLGASLHNVPAQSFSELVGATRWSLVQLQGEMADEDADAVTTAVGRRVIDLAMNRGFGKLAELDGRIKREPLRAGTLQRERQALQETLGMLQQERSLLEQGDPAGRFATRRLIAKALADRDREDLESSLALRQLNSILPRPREGDTRFVDQDFGMRGAPIDPLRQLGRVQRLGGALSELLASRTVPDGLQQAMRHATSAALQEHKLSRLGLTPEEIEAGGVMAAVRKNFPGVYFGVAAQAGLRPGVVEGLTAAEHESGLNEVSRAAVSKAVDSMLTTPAEKLKAFDPNTLSSAAPLTAHVAQSVEGAAVALGRAFEGAMVFTDNLMRGIGSRTLHTMEALDLKLQPWQQQQIDHEAIKRGIAEGDLDMATLMRWTGDDHPVGFALAYVMENLGGELANIGEFVRFASSGRVGGGDTDKLGLGQLAAERLRQIPEAELTPDLARAVLTDAVNELAQNALDLPAARKELERLRHRAADEFAGGNWLSGMYESVKAGLLQVGYVELKENLGFATSNPNALPIQGALAWAGGAVGGSIFRTADSALNKVAARMTLSRRMRQAIRDLSAHDPKALEAVVRANQTSGIKGLSERQLLGMTSIMEQLADEAVVELRDAARLTTRDHDRFWRQRARKVRDLDKHLRPLNSQQLGTLLDRMSVGDEFMAAVREPVRVSVLGEMFNEIGNRTRLGGFKLLNSTRIRNADNIARRVDGAIRRGASLEEIQGLTTPIVGFEDGYRWWGERLAERVGIASQLTMEDVSLPVQVAGWVRDHGDAVIALRDYNQLVRGRQKDLIGLALRHNQTQIDVLRSVDPDSPSGRREMGRLNGERSRLRAALEEVDARGWEQSVELSKNSAVRDVLDLYDLRTWNKITQNDPDEWRAWVQYGKRKDGVVVETHDQFVARMEELENLEEGLFNGEITGAAAKRARRRIDRAKRQILRASHDRRMASEFLKVDDDVIFERRFVDDIKARRAKADPEELAELPEIHEKKIDVELERLREIANSVDASVKHNVFDRMGGWRLNRQTEMVDYLRQVQMSRKAELRAHEMASQYFLEELSKLNNFDRQAFNDALADAARGDFRTYDAFLEARPDVRARFFEGTADENIGAAFRRMESARADLLARMRDTGQISVEAYERFVRPYSPQLYSVDEFPSAVASEFAAQAEELAGGRLALAQGGAATPSSGLFEVQRDLYQTRLLVQRNGNSWINKLFDSPDEARDWLRRHSDLGDETAIDGGWRGTTSYGDSYTLMRPLGEEAAQALGLVDRGAALGKRMAQMIRESALYDLFEAAQRPGWSVDSATYLRAVQTPDGRRRYRNFVELAVPDSPMFRPLRGRYIHKRAARLLQHYMEGEEFVELMQRELTEASLADATGLGRPIAKIFGVLQGSGRVIRRMLSTNLISRNPATHIGNRLYDRQVLARVAGGPGYLYSEEGKLAFRQSRDFMLAFGQHGSRPDLPFGAPFNAGKSLTQELAAIRRADPELAGLIDDGIRAGMLGDSMVGNPLTGELRKAVTDAMWGPSETAFAKQVLGRTDERVLRAQQRMRGRLAQVEDSLERWANGQLEIDDRTAARLSRERATLEVATRQFGGPETMGRRIADFPRWLMGTKSTRGLFGEIDNWATQLYAREGNIDRLGVYIYLRRKGLGDEVARRRVQKFMQDYSNVRGFTRMLRNNPLANPVFSYPSEWMRINMNILRESPGVLLGMAAVAPALSSITLLSQGLDPVDYYMAMARGSVVDAIDMATGTLIIPTPDGQGVATVESPALSPLQMLRKPTGFMGDLVEATEEDGAAGASLLGGGLRVASRFVGSNPLLDAAYTQAAGKDPLTRERFAGGVLQRTGRATRQMSRLFVPAAWPWYSSTSEQVLDSLRTPPNMNTNRITTTAERVLQAYFGIRTRGGLIDNLDDLAEATTGVRPAATLSRGLASIMAAGVVSEVPVIVPADLPRSKGFDDTDIATMLFYASSKFRVDDGPQRDFFLDDVQQDLRTGAYFLQRAEEKGDTKAKAWAERLISGARKRLEEQIGDRRAFAGLSEQADLQLDREAIRRVQRMARSGDLGEQFSRAPLLQQTMTLIGASRMGLDQTIIDDLVERTIFVHKGRPDISTWTNPAEVGAAIAHLTDHLRNTESVTTGTDSLGWLLSMLERAEPRARRREEEERLRDEAVREAADIWKEFEQIPVK